MLKLFPNYRQKHIPLRQGVTLKFVDIPLWHPLLTIAIDLKQVLMLVVQV